MRIRDLFQIKGRGIAASTEGAPKDCLGAYLRQGDRAWKIVGVEHPELNGCRGLLLRAEAGSPEKPEIGPVEIVESL